MKEDRHLIGLTRSLSSKSAYLFCQYIAMRISHDKGIPDLCHEIQMDISGFFSPIGSIHSSEIINL